MLVTKLDSSVPDSEDEDGSVSIMSITMATLAHGVLCAVWLLTFTAGNITQIYLWL